MPHPSQDFEGLAAQVQHKADVQNANLAAALAAKSGSSSTAKRLVTVVLLGLLCIIFFLQLPRFSEPFEWPDPQKDSTVAEAELEVTGSLIEAFKLAQGRLPTSLSEVSLPPALRQRAANAGLTYEQANGSYVLTWTTPHVKVVLDGASGRSEVLSASKR